MNSYDPFGELVQNVNQRMYGLDSVVDCATRETERSRRIQQLAESPMLRYAEDLRLQENLARLIQPSFADRHFTRIAAPQRYFDSLIRNEEVLSRLTAQAVAQQHTFDLSWIIEQKMAHGNAFARTMESFGERIIRETQLLDGLVGKLSSAYGMISLNIAPSADYEELLGVVARGFEETGLTRSDFGWQPALWHFEDWLKGFPPNVRKVVIGMIIGLALIAVKEAIDYCKDAFNTKAAQVQNDQIPPEPKHTDGSGDMCR